MANILLGIYIGIGVIIAFLVFMSEEYENPVNAFIGFLISIGIGAIWPLLLFTFLA